MCYNIFMERCLVKILECDVDSFSFDEAVDYAYSTPGQVVTINPEMISNANSHPDLAKVISDAELVVPDGIGVELGLKILGHNVHRIAGIELGKALIEKFSNEGKSVAFIGAKPEIVKGAVENLKSEFPSLNPVYVKDGYFDDTEAVLSEVADVMPDLVLVALGHPKQEFFISALKQRLGNATMIGLGGSFDVWAGYVKRAPVFWQKLGLEWLYRTLKEPKRLKRIFPVLPLFVIRVFKERLCKV